MELVLIAAVSENQVIGKDGKLPWPKIPEDMKRFRELTIGNPVLMGRKTYESIGKPLDKRINIVLSNNTDFSPSGVYVARTLDEALQQCQEFEMAYVIGGQTLYEQTISFADTLEITTVHQIVDGDRYFPQIHDTIWNLVKTVPRDGYTFKTYWRR